MRTCQILVLWAVWAVAGRGYSDPPSETLNWPRFRGPNGTGISHDARVPVEWNETSGVLWKSALPGSGNSSPVVWGDRIFLQSASQDGRQRLLFCLNAASGKTLWTRSVPGSKADINPRNTLASSTPATDGRRVYAAFWDGTKVTLSACDMSGAPIWSRDLGTFSSQHGAGASPIIYNDKVILAYDQDTSSVLLALDSGTGETVWQAPRQAFAACYSTPFVLESPGERAQLIVASTAGVSGYDPVNGGIIWNWTWVFTGKPLRTVASPVFGDGFVFATSGDGGGARHMVALQLSGKGATTQARMAWESTRTFPYVPTMLVREGHLYWVSDMGIAGCHEIKTGKSLWTARLGGNFSASPVLISGRIYAANEDGEVFVIAASPMFKLLAKNPIGELVRASPAVSNNRLYIRGQSHLFCIAQPGE